MAWNTSGELQLYCYLSRWSDFSHFVSIFNIRTESSMNQAQYAKHRGISQARVSVLIRKGYLKMSIKMSETGRYEINAELADKELDSNLDPGWNEAKKKPIKSKKSKSKKKVKGDQKKKPQDDSKLGSKSGEQTRDHLQIKIEKEQWLTKLKQQEFERKAGRLIEVDLVRKQAFEAGKHIKEQCLSIPDRCAPLVAATSDAFECKEILTKEISFILENLSTILEVKIK